MMKLVGVGVLFLFSGTVSGQDDKIDHWFEILDQDGSGTISQSEFTSAPDSVFDSQLAADGRFELADVNEDGKIDQAEFSAFEDTVPVE